LEAGGDELLGSAVQPLPVILGGKLVHLGPMRGAAPPTEELPRPIPDPLVEPTGVAEPDTIEALLERATELIGVQLGERGRDKGEYGARIASLLGVEESGFSEPDWRGEVEIKTVPVVRDPAGWWRVKEDPAVSMLGASPIEKLRRVLWVARVADDSSSPILSWYFQEWDGSVAELVERYLHTRPKGPRGTSNRGWYLHKRFFVDSGFLKSLNG
jgi:hypothetical protein